MYSLILERTVYTVDQLVPLATPQVALAGRSNVGKSSLVNCLAGRKRELAKVSATPGKTRSLNFYRVEQHDLVLVDLPGYGYAKCSKKERESWSRLIAAYFRQVTSALKATVVLIDCRHTPQRLDLELAAFLQHQRIPLVPVLTKADKCKQNERAARMREWNTLLAGVEPLLFSSKTGYGRDTLWRRLLAFAGEECIPPEAPASS